MILNQNFQDKIRPSELSYIILNHLHVFDQKPEQIEIIIEKFKKLKDDKYTHPLYTHNQFYEKVYYEYYEKHKKFPDIEWIAAALPDMSIKKEQGNFSTAIYEDFIEILDREGVKRLTEKLIVDNQDLPIEDVQTIVKALTEYSVKCNVVKKRTKEDILNIYEEYSKDYTGVRTHIKELDDLIGALGYKSISVIGAPSGNGKTSIATTIAYNAAVMSGLCVDYITFEVSEQHMWFNLASIESTYHKEIFPAVDWKEPIAITKEDKQKNNEKYLYYQNSMINKLKISGGWINPIDYARLSSYTFEEMCAKLESQAEERGRKADLVVIDNVDGFTIFKSNERDALKKVDNMIRSLDQFSKTYYNNEGTHFLLLTQVNREGMFTLKDASSTESETSTNSRGRKKKKACVDVTCISTYNALYEKGTSVLIAHADEKLRSLERMHIYPVKLRNRATGMEPIKLSTNFACSRIGGDSLIEANIDDYEEFKKREQEKEESKANVDAFEGDFEEE